MSYQIQLTGVSLSRPSSSPRKWLRWTLLAFALMLAGVVGWQYLMPSRTSVVHPVTAASATTAAKVAIAKPSAPAAPAAEPVAKLPPALKQATDSGVVALWTYLAESLNLAPSVPQPQTAPVNPSSTRPEVAAAPVAAAPSVPKAPVAAKPKPRWRPLTPEQQLQRAGEVAMGNMLVLASKYPDSYGFRAEDIFEQAKLGNPIPVYTIKEADQANYKAGQPVKSLLVPADKWVFPVWSGNHICCMVQVKYDGHDYVPDSNSRSLAEAWSKILEKWPAEQGFHPQLVISSAVPGYYFTIPELPSPNLTDTVQMTFYNPSVSPADVILASWR